MSTGYKSRFACAKDRDMFLEVTLISELSGVYSKYAFVREK